MTPQPRERYDLPSHHGLAGYVFVLPSHKNGSGTDAVRNFGHSRTGKASQKFLPSQFYVAYAASHLYPAQFQRQAEGLTYARA